MADRVTDHVEVLRERRAQRELHVARVRLRDQRHHGRAAVAQCSHQRVVGRTYAGAPGGPERREPGVAQVELVRARAKNSVSLGLEPGHPPSMNPTPSSSSCRAMASFGDGEVQPLLLRTVAQRRVVDVELAVGVQLLPSWSLSCSGGGARGNKKTPRRDRGLRVGVPDALGDDDGGVTQDSMAPHDGVAGRISGSDRPRDVTSQQTVSKNRSEMPMNGPPFTSPSWP